MTKTSRAGVKQVTVGPMPAEIHTSQRRPREELTPRGGRIPAPHLLKQEQLQLAGASCFRDLSRKIRLCLLQKELTILWRAGVLSVWHCSELLVHKNSVSLNKATAHAFYNSGNARLLEFGKACHCHTKHVLTQSLDGSGSHTITYLAHTCQ